MQLWFVAAALAVAPYVSAQSPVYGQCGGQNWTGATTCASGSACVYSNPYYSQCLPGASTTTSVKPTTTTTTSTKPTTTTTSTAPTTTTAPPPSSTGFVKVSGQKFTLNGATYTVAGTNAYWLAQNTNADIDTAFSDIAAAGLTTVRTWGFNDVTAVQNYGAYYQLWTNGVPTVNTGSNGLGKFDYVVQSAKAHGLRLIVTLTNNWSDYGGMDVYVSQLNSGGTHDTFYTNAKIISAYENYINAWVTRYKNESTIMAWELANEPRCSGSTGSASSACDTTGSTIQKWASTISAYIKSIDPNHLVAIGDEGWFQEANPPTYPYAPGVGVNFVNNLQISTLDFGTAHSYPESWGQTANETLWGVDWITAHAAAQKTANKPVILEEFGVTVNQASTYQLWYNTIISSGLTGNLIWQAGSQLSTGPSPNDGYAKGGWMNDD
ncbi:glycoside hydrolase family 5 protein [Sphaerobolus stellatus SS14]|uniref:mannan endo-1,4-beta-mannosidase n=1 Tax=Sphaerobolus stellatus (strain SS14) TaxID=990650 RepID=A0A0C9V809_SPHS4|nr:glycoside hydrolase family 5 protein [Sphaerobolus stellatus SS14]